MRPTLTRAARPLTWLLLLPAAGGARPPGALGQTRDLVAIGTYTRGAPHQGIWLEDFDPATGTLSPPRLAAETSDPSFLAQSPEGTTLAACNERTNTVSTFVLDRSTRRLTARSQQPCPGAPAHVGISGDGRVLVASNYGGGTVAVFPLNQDGALQPAVRTFALPGPLGPDPRRQAQSHPHSVAFAPDGATVLICDLGADRIFGYGLIRQAPFLTPSPRFAADVLPGSGPRHAVFARDGRHFYVVNEMAATVAVFAWPSQDRAPIREQTISLLPPEVSGPHAGAEIALSPDERFLYTSIRGPDLLTVLARDEQGRWQRIQTLPCGGQVPRCFALDPTGHWLLCAHQKSASLALFRVDAATGRLEQRTTQAGPSEPACVLWLR